MQNERLYSSTFSLTKLGQGGDDWGNGVVGVDEWWAVSWTPWELSGSSDDDWVFNQVLWGQITNLLLERVIPINIWEEFGHLHLADLGDIADVMESFNLIEMHQVVGHPEVVVVVHGNIKSLHCFSSSATLGDSTINTVFSLHELLILGLDLIDNIWSVDICSVSIPVNGWKFTNSSWFSVEKVKNACQLWVLFSWFVGVGSSSQSVQPLQSQVIVYCIKNKLDFRSLRPSSIGIRC